MSIHLARPRRALRLRYSSLAIIVFVGLLFFFSPSVVLPATFPGWTSAAAAPHELPSGSESLGPANSTLGFGNIYVVSTPTSARREPLLHAANITELDLTIPLQPEWTEEDQRKFRLKENSTLGRGSLLAWLGHLHALREFMASGAETALLLEDDVDWDIRLRTRQIPLVQRAVRYLTTPPGGDTDSDGDAAHRYPYGNPSRWDLLYLGHCGDYFHGMDIGFNRGHVKPKDLAELPHASFRDSTMLGWDNLHPWTTSLLQNLGVPEKTRLVHRSRFPLCTFAYAVTRASAHRLLTELAATEPNREGSHAYDVMILRACISDGLRCLSVNPELFHHIMGKSMIAGVEKNDNLPPVDAKGYNQVLLRNETTNIGCGYWSGAFNFKDDDVNRLAWLREEVGRKGRCLKPGRDLPG